MASKKDPFNFDDVYSAVGAEGFIKKSMAELKTQQPAAPSPANRPSVQPAAQRTTHTVTRPAGPAAKPAANFDLDFLSNIGGPSTSNRSPGMSHPSSSAASTASADPFAAFNEVPGAAPAVAMPKAASATTPGSSTANLLDLDDGMSFNGPPAAQPPQQHVDTPARAAQPPAQQPQPGAAFPEAFPEVFSATHRLVTPEPAPHGESYSQLPQQRSTGLDGTGAPAGRAAASAPAMQQAQPPPSYGSPLHAGLQKAPESSVLPPLYNSPLHAGLLRVVPPDSSSPPPPSYAAASAASPAYHEPPQTNQYYFGGGARDPTGRPAAPATLSDRATAAAAASSSGGGAGSGITGYLKAFAKKAVSATKAGIQQLEQALESMDQQAGAAASRQGQGRVSGDGRRFDDEDEQISHDEALAWAVRLADMTPHQQEEHLSQMARPLRQRVLEVLREQARVETEAVVERERSRQTLQTTEYDPMQDEYKPHLPAAGSSSYKRSGTGGSRHGGSSSGFDSPPPARQPPPPPPAAAPAPAPVRAPAPAPAPVPAPVPEPATSHDLLGLGSGDMSAAAAAIAAPAMAPAAPALAPQPAPQAEHGDLLGLGDDARPPAAAAAPAQRAAAAPAAQAAPAAPPPPQPQPAAMHVDDIDDEFFSGGAKAAPAAPAAPRAQPAPAAVGAASSSFASAAPAARASASASAGPGISMMEMFDTPDVDTTQFKELYDDDAGHEGEPELRKQLRAQRLAAKHAKMKTALAEKLAQEQEEARRREEQVSLKDQYKANVEAWRNKSKGNVRGLLASLQTVLWPDSGWTPIGMGDLLEPNQVRKAWMKANLLVHPDKVRQRNGSADQVAIADMIFDVLKDAWNQFQR